MGGDRKITVHDWAYVLNESEHAHDIDSTKFNGVSLRQELVRLYAAEAELAASRQRVSELEDQRDEAHGGVSRQRMELADMRAELAKRDKSIVRLSAELVVLRDTLASREAALREIRAMADKSCQWAIGDRAAQEVGR